MKSTRRWQQLLLNSLAIILGNALYSLAVAEKLCDRVAIIRAGRLVRAGSMDEVRGDDSLEEVFLELEGTEAQA